jgi:hypothetical protein
MTGTSVTLRNTAVRQLPLCPVRDRGPVAVQQVAQGPLAVMSARMMSRHKNLLRGALGGNARRSAGTSRPSNPREPLAARSSPERPGERAYGDCASSHNLTARPLGTRARQTFFERWQVRLSPNWRPPLRHSLVAFPSRFAQKQCAFSPSDQPEADFLSCGLGRASLRAYKNAV